MSLRDLPVASHAPRRSRALPRRPERLRARPSLPRPRHAGAERSPGAGHGHDQTGPTVAVGLLRVWG
ncbi:hypothetical protein PR202_gb03344 [Eleusine coracana subsp. coracana]|uniref:Uncharacterized protein n=1 Tax=Eleusine coracana subsp. coracana TaxID=191504 RepID=A0AAV5E1K5_ELECO|nr:hypothetical protein PR202_gb03264 [Eleusine coracana subsp. coracana]GJN16361.1 hypothetical protein PR202_gb03344 [Eleusine coracana subsp. coracana]